MRKVAELFHGHQLSKGDFVSIKCECGNEFAEVIDGKDILFICTSCGNVVESKGVEVTEFDDETVLFLDESGEIPIFEIGKIIDRLFN